MFADARGKPIKTSTYLALVGGLVATSRFTPDRRAFYHQLLSNSNDLALVDEATRNQATSAHYSRIRQLEVGGLLRFINIGLVSIAWHADDSARTDLAQVRCKHLKPDWQRPLAFFHERVEDIGFAGRWWVLDQAMVDYDVNPAEFGERIVNEQAWQLFPFQSDYRVAVSVPSAKDVIRVRQVFEVRETDNADE